MMSAGGTYISTASVEVPQALQDGEKFIKWDDVSTIQTDLQLLIERMWKLLYNLLYYFYLNNVYNYYSITTKYSEIIWTVIVIVHTKMEHSTITILVRV